MIIQNHYYILSLILFYLSVADATGKLPDGIFKLDLQTYGNMPECLDIDVIGQNGLDPFK